MATANRQIRLAARPVGYPKESDFELVEAPPGEPGAGEVLVRSLFVSVDPYMRGRISGIRSYARPVDIGEVMGGGAVGRVVASRNPKFRDGDVVEGMLGWQDYAISDGVGLRRVDPDLGPISTALGVLGMTGMTAYFGLLEVGRPNPGETVVVSGAAGAVGSLVGQIARIRGCRAVGIAGTDEKVAYVVGELGFDAAFNYRTTPDPRARLLELCPRGIDVYFDNVGGAITDAVLALINPRARISICGQISQYNLEAPEPGPRPFVNLLVKQARAEGFLVFQFAERYPEAREQMARWLREGKLRYAETIVDGLENAPRAFIGMLRGDNTGKALVKVSEP